MKRRGLPACGIKRTAEGLDMAEVERLFQTEEIKFFTRCPDFIIRSAAL
ncbi:hypothetical protein QNN00_01485 [Bacillus velezensis]|nr:hypothetical protein [Bacillus velezensis]